MNTRFKSMIIGLSLALALTCAFAQTNETTSTSSTSTETSVSFWDALTGAFSVDNTNGILYANCLNVTPSYVWIGEDNESAGMIQADWWTDLHRGMRFTYEMRLDDESRYGVAYQVRTLFAKTEVALGVGVLQSTSDSFGNVKLFAEPSLSYKLPIDSMDISIFAAARIYNGGQPDAIGGIKLTFWRQ